jgi:UDP-N-acetylglucosamine 2-epimerase (non-hydrolysing)
MVVIGTRPEAIKLFPVVQALQRSLLRPIVVNSGQHADMVTPVLDLAGIKADVDLAVARPGQTINSVLHEVILGLDNLLTDLRGGPERRARPRLFGAAGSDSPYPAAMIVHGDTTTALGAALTAAGVMIPVLHVEAGLRTGQNNSPFPEEFNRQLIARIASFHFAPIVANEQNLVREGIDARRIFVTGNTGLDALAWAAAQRAPWTDRRLAAIEDHPGPVIVVTAHRRENWGGGITGIAEGIARIATARPDSLTVFPMHPNPRLREMITPVLAEVPNVLLVEPMEYAEFARLLACATMAITDSGGVQEEAPSLGTPVLVTREASERMEGLEAGTLKLVGTDPTRISATALTLLDDSEEYERMSKSVNPFGDGHASERIAAALEHLIFGTAAPRPFGPGFDRFAVLESAGYDPGQVEGALRWAERLARDSPQR